MGRWIAVMALLWTGVARGQAVPDAALPVAPVSKATWTTLAGLGAEILADGVTTRVLYQRRHDEINPVIKPFVHAGVPGQIAASLLGAGAAGGMWFVLRRTHHDRAANWFLRSVTTAEGANVLRQFTILRASGNGNDPSASGTSQSPPVRRHSDTR